MKCRTCGTEIAEKALICYRCGTATTEPRIPAPRPKPARGPVPVVIAMLVIIAAAAFMLPELPEGAARMAGWAAVVIVTALAVWTMRPTPRKRRR